jgi:uncharacterized membrane protein YeaQ/YmgE (transglycosylase-associated protein family)
MGIISWIIFGAIAGWVASIIAGNNDRQGCIGNIIVGVVGAFLGGFLVELVTGQGFQFNFEPTSFIVAIVGAVLLLAIMGATRRRSK